MLGLGSVRTLMMDAQSSNKIQFDLNGFLQNIVLADLNQNGKCV